MVEENSYHEGSVSNIHLYNLSKNEFGAKRLRMLNKLIETMKQTANKTQDERRIEMRKLQTQKMNLKFGR